MVLQRTGILKIAGYCLREVDLKEGAFNLHQAAERTYNAIILVHAGYKSKTHNLGKLKRYSKRFSEELDAIFPDNTPQEKHLFDLLKRGYIDTRYKEHYEITAEELTILIERVGKLETQKNYVVQDVIENRCLYNTPDR
jgi:uncharacterized protein